MQTGKYNCGKELYCSRQRSMPYNIRTAMQDNTHTAVYDNQKMKMRR